MNINFSKEPIAQESEQKYTSGQYLLGHTVLADKLSAGGWQERAEGLLAEDEDVHNVAGSLWLRHRVGP